MKALIEMIRRDSEIAPTLIVTFVDGRSFRFELPEAAVTDLSEVEGRFHPTWEDIVEEIP